MQFLWEEELLICVKILWLSPSGGDIRWCLVISADRIVVCPRSRLATGTTCGSSAKTVKFLDMVVQLGAGDQPYTATTIQFSHVYCLLMAENNFTGCRCRSNIGYISSLLNARSVWNPSLTYLTSVKSKDMLEGPTELQMLLGSSSKIHILWLSRFGNGISHAADKLAFNRTTLQFTLRCCLENCVRFCW